MNIENHHLISSQIPEALAKDSNTLDAIRYVQIQMLNQSCKFNAVWASNIPTGKINETGFYPIGIWHPEMQDGEIVFLRNDQREDSVLWESTRKIIKLHKKKNTKRICFLGESAAAGMFFTPNLTPAITLECYLTQNEGKIDWEVIDLTSISINSAGLLETCKACIQLNPDAVVILAGNNWFSGIAFEHNAPIVERINYLDSMDLCGTPGIAAEYKKNIEEQTQLIFHRFDEISNRNSAKFIFALPASNYQHWERHTPITWLGSGKTRQWHLNFSEALHAMEEGDYEKSLKIGHKLLQLDDGTSSASNRLVANSLINLKRFDEAHPYCVAEVNYANLFTKITSTPGMPSFAKRKIKATKTGISILDIEEIYIDFLGKKILDKSLFVDYCHMSPLGFKVAMAPIAAEILND